MATLELNWDLQFVSDLSFIQSIEAIAALLTLIIELDYSSLFYSFG